MESLHKHMEVSLISEEFEAGLVSRCTPKYRRRYVGHWVRRKVPADLSDRIRRSRAIKHHFGLDDGSGTTIHRF